MTTVRRLQAVVETDGVGAFTSKMAAASTATGKFRKAIAATGAVLGGAMVASLGSAVIEAAKFEEQMVEVEKVTDPQTAREMGDAIQEMAGQMPIAQKELAQMTADAGRFGIRGSENIRNFTEAVGRMVTATDLGAEEAGEAFARLATLTNTPISDIENLGSSINALSNNAATSAGEIVDSMLRSSAALSNLGASNTEIVAMSSALNEVSESSERAGSRLRRLGQEITSASGSKLEQMRTSLGMTVEEFKNMRAEDPTRLIQQMATVMSQGGDQARNLGDAFSTTSRQALAGLGKNLDGLNQQLEMSRQEFDANTSLQKEFAAANSTAMAAATRLQNKIRTLAIETGQHLLPYVKQAAEGLGTLVDGLIEARRGATQAQTALVAAGSAISTVAGVAAYFAGGPAGLLVAALGAIGTAYATNFGGMQDTINAIASALNDEFIATFQVAKRTIVPIMRDLASAFGVADQSAEDVVGNIAAAFGQDLIAGIRSAGAILRTVLRGLATFWEQHGDTIVATVRDLYIGVRDAFTLVETVITDLQGAFGTFDSTVRGILGGLGGAIGTLLVSVVRFQASQLRTVVSGMSALWEEHGDKVIAAIRAYGNYVEWVYQNLISPAIRGIMRLWRQHGEDIVRELRETWTAIQPIIQPALTLMENSIMAVIDVVSIAWGRWGDEILRTARFVFDTVGSAAGAFIDILSSIIITGLNIIQGDWDAAFAEMRGLAQRIFTGIKNFLGKWFGNIGQRFAQFIDDVVGEFLRLGQRLIWGSIIPEMLGAIHDRFVQFITNTLARIGAFVQNTITDFINLGARVRARMNEALAGLHRRFVQFITNTLARIRLFIDDAIAGYVWLGNRLLTVVSGFLGDIHRRFAQFIGNTLSRIRTFVSDVIGEFQHLANRLIHGSVVPDMLGAMHGRFAQFATNTRNRIFAWAGGMESRIGTLGNRMKSTMSSALNEVEDIAGDIAGEARGALDKASDAISDARRKLRNFDPDPPSFGGSSSSSSSSSSSGGSSSGGVGGPGGMGVMHAGGTVESTGAAYLQAGEEVIPKAEVSRKRTTGDGTNISIGTIEASSYEEGREAIRGMLDEVDAQLR